MIGDIVTGSYHLTELEALAQGKVVICNPDARTLLTLFNLTGCRDLPFVVSGVETLHDVLKHIVSHPSLIKDIGKFSRKWAETYYNDKILIQNYVKIYKDLISGKPIIRSGSSDYAEAKNFLYNSLFDIEYNYHKKATLSLFKLKCLYWRKKLLSKITFGKKRKRFKQERKALKKQIKKLKAL